MAELVGVPIVGVVENMSYFQCPDTGKHHYIFGPSHSEEVTLAAQAPLLAQIPFTPQYTARCDTGRVEFLESDEITGMVKAFLEALPL